MAKNIDLEWPDSGREFTLREMLDQVGAEQQVEILASLVKKYRCEKVGAYGIAEASRELESLKHGEGSRTAFDLVIDQLVSAIERRQAELKEEEMRPLAERGAKDLVAKRSAGENSHGLSKEERTRRDDAIIADFEKMKARGKTEGEIFRFLGAMHKLHKDTVRKIVKEPRL